MPGRIWLFASAADPGAAAVAAAMPAGSRCTWVAAEDIDAAAISWRLDGASVRAALRLPQGEILAPAAGDVVLNRLPPAVPPAFAAAEAKERSYALSEAAAVRHAWLAGLPARIINPPSAAQGWTERGLLRWLALAGRVGLPVCAAVAASPGRAAGPRDDLTAIPIDPTRWDGVHPGVADALLPGRAPQLFLVQQAGDDRALLAFAGQAAGSFPPSLQEGALRLAAAAGLDLLEVRFATAAGGALRFAGASTQPDLLRPGEAAFVAARLAEMVA